MEVDTSTELRPSLTPLMPVRWAAPLRRHRRGPERAAPGAGEGRRWAVWAPLGCSVLAPWPPLRPPGAPSRGAPLWRLGSVHRRLASRQRRGARSNSSNSSNSSSSNRGSNSGGRVLIVAEPAPRRERLSGAARGRAGGRGSSACLCSRETGNDLVSTPGSCDSGLAVI